MSYVSDSKQEQLSHDKLLALLMRCAIKDISFVDCLYQANAIIQKRKGYLTPEGIFVKQE